MIKVGVVSEVGEVVKVVKEGGATIL